MGVNGLAWVLWTAWTVAAITLAHCARQDWHNPKEDRVVVAVTVGFFATLLIAAAVLIVVKT